MLISLRRTHSPFTGSDLSQASWAFKTQALSLRTPSAKQNPPLTSEVLLFSSPEVPGPNLILMENIQPLILPFSLQCMQIFLNSLIQCIQKTTIPSLNGTMEKIKARLKAKGPTEDWCLFNPISPFLSLAVPTSGGGRWARVCYAMLHRFSRAGLFVTTWTCSPPSCSVHGIL